MKKLDNKGNAMVIVVAAILGIFSTLAVVTDYGVAAVEKYKLSNAIDAATLAAIQDLVISEAKAEATAVSYLQKNGYTTEGMTIVADALEGTVRIQGVQTVPTIFARVMGINQVSVNSVSKAMIGTASSVSGGLRPFGVEDRYYGYGELITLKYGAGDGYHGNYGALALGGTGACVLKNNALYGYEGTLKIGDRIYTEPGNMSSVVSAIATRLLADGSTWNNYDRSSYRLWTIPILDSLDVNGRKLVTITGFATVFVENVEKKSGKMEIKARFIEFVSSGDIDTSITNKGVYAVKMIE